MKKILLIGCGHMGSALLASWERSNQYSITVIDPIKNKDLTKKFKSKNIKILQSISRLENNLKFNYLILAIKPIDLSKVLSELSNYNFNSNIAVISVIAGKNISFLKKNFTNLKYFFRVMPNMPAAIGESMNCVVSNKINSKSKNNEIKKLFSHSGKTIFLKNENQIDMSTAISGSGPGFVFNIIDAMEQAAINLGFNKKIANILVSQTFKGSIDLLLRNKYSSKRLVSTVATKGGTTEAGLKVMKKNKLHKIFLDVAKASYAKAKKQGK